MAGTELETKHTLVSPTCHGSYRGLAGQMTCGTNKRSDQNSSIPVVKQLLVGGGEKEEERAGLGLATSPAMGKTGT